MCIRACLLVLALSDSGEGLVEVMVRVHVSACHIPRFVSILQGCEQVAQFFFGPQFEEDPMRCQGLGAVVLEWHLTSDCGCPLHSFLIHPPFIPRRPTRAHGHACTPMQGPNSAETIILGGHIDSTAGSATAASPGADDDASGSATVLQVIKPREPKAGRACKTARCGPHMASF